MFCIHCGKEIPDGVKFCPYCGGNLAEAAEVAAVPPSITPPPTPVLPPREDTYRTGNLPLSADAPHTGAGEVPHTRAQAEKRREDQRKRNNQIILIAVVIIIAVAFTFLFVIAPKVLGMQLLPFDPFGFHQTESAPPIAAGESGDSSPAAAESTAAKIEAVYLKAHPFGTGDETIQGISGNDGSPLLMDNGTTISLTASVGPEEAAEDAHYEWTLSGDANVVDFNYQNSEATVNAYALGEVYVTVKASGAQGSSATANLHIVIGTGEPEDTLYPFKGTIFVTNEPKLGIFVRSEHVVNGEGKKLNDGNKIAWIEGGNTSVELAATGNEYDEGPNGYWWYEVEVPQWYRDTAKQTENYAGKSLIGWVRADVVREK